MGALTRVVQNSIDQGIALRDRECAPSNQGSRGATRDEIWKEVIRTSCERYS